MRLFFANNDSGAAPGSPKKKTPPPPDVGRFYFCDFKIVVGLKVLFFKNLFPLYQGLKIPLSRGGHTDAFVRTSFNVLSLLLLDTKRAPICIPPNPSGADPSFPSGPQVVFCEPLFGRNPGRQDLFRSVLCSEPHACNTFCF